MPTLNQKQLGRTVNILDLPSGGLAGTAYIVDTTRAIIFNQTTTNQTITLPNPTDTVTLINITIANNGSATFTIYGSFVPTGSSILVVWNAGAWSAIGIATANNAISIVSSPNIGLTGAALSSYGSLTSGAITLASPIYANNTSNNLSLTTSGALRTILICANGNPAIVPILTPSAGYNAIVIGAYSSTVQALADGTASTVALDSTAAQMVNTEGQKYTYKAAFKVAVVTLASDVFTISGSGFRTVRIKSIKIGANATAATTGILSIIRRSTANSGGTSVTVAAGSNDTLNPASGVNVVRYSANPTTLGTLVSTLDIANIGFPLISTAAFNIELVYGQRVSQPIVLRGVSDFLCANFGGASAFSGAVLSVAIEWTEE